MPSYLMSLMNRRKKRQIFLRASRLLGDLKDTLREIESFSGDMSVDYKSVGSAENARLASEVRTTLNGLDIIIGGKREKLDSVLLKFNNLPEEIS